MALFFAEPSGAASPTLSGDSPNRKLSLRSTFIDVVDEDSEEEQVTIVRSKRRVKTAPCAASFVERERHEKFSVERAYVENLSEKMASLSFGVQRTTMEFFEADPHPLLRYDALEPCYIQTQPAQGSSLEDAMPGVTGPANCQRIIAGSPISPHLLGFDGLSPSQQEAASGFTERFPRDGKCAAAEMFIPQPRPLAASRLSSVVLGPRPTKDIAARLSDSESDQEVNEEVAGNPGSIGHPELCNRPCLFFAAGTCTNIDSCDFCHNSHKKRLVHLDKRHRDMLHELPLERWSALVLPMLGQRALLVDGSSATSAILKMICSPCGGSYDEPLPHDRSTPWTNRSERSVFLKLKSMTLRSLLGTVERSLEQRSINVKGAVGFLLNHLRGSLAQ